jgi:hypothetical protein
MINHLFRFFNPETALELDAIDKRAERELYTQGVIMDHYSKITANYKKIGQLNNEGVEMTLTKDQAIKRINDIHGSKSCDHLKTGVSLDSHLMTLGAIEELKAIFDISDKETLGGEFDKFEHVVRFVKSIEKFKEPKHKSVVWIDIALAPKDRAIVVYDPKPSKEYGPDVHAAIWSEDHGRFIANENVDTDPLDINPESFTYDITPPHSQTPSD